MTVADSASSTNSHSLRNATVVLIVRCSVLTAADPVRLVCESRRALGAIEETLVGLACSHGDLRSIGSRPCGTRKMGAMQGSGVRDVV